MSEVPTLYILFNKDCLDAYVAAWAVSKTFDNAEYVPLTDNSSVDFDFPKNSYLVFLGCKLKHPEVLSLTVKYTVTIIERNEVNAHNFRDLERKQRVTLVVDASHSLASLAWNYFLGDKPPILIDYVRDTVLKLYKKGNAKEIEGYLKAAMYDITNFKEAFDQLNKDLSTKLQTVIEEGSAYVDPGITEINQYLNNYYIKTVEGQQMAIVNSASDVATLADAILNSKEANTVLVWYVGIFEGKPQVSIYMKSDGDVDVLDIAKRYGGSGYPTAASFKTSPNYVKVLL